MTNKKISNYLESVFDINLPETKLANQVRIQMDDGEDNTRYINLEIVGGGGDELSNFLCPNSVPDGYVM